MGNKFTEVERKYRSLLQSYEEGGLDVEQFAQALEDLKLQDEQEQWWQIQGNGKWLRFNDEVWVEAVPPRPLPPPPPRSALIPPPRHAPGPVPAPAAPERQPQPPVEEGDDSIFFQTGVPADQIPGLAHPEPSPAAFLLEQEDVIRPVAQPITLKPPPPANPGAMPTHPAPPIVLAPPRPDPTPTAPAPAAGQALTCPGCHRKVVPGAHFCKYCGTKPVPTPAPSPQIQSEPTPQPPPIPQPTGCPACHQPLLPNAKFCGKCGHALAAPLCPKCRVATLPGAHFCKSCGQKLN